MSRVRFVSKHDIELFLQSFVLNREIFLPDKPLTFWKCAYDSVEAIELVLESRLHRWKGTEMEIPLKLLKKRTTKFIKQIKKNGNEHGSWQGASPECNALLNHYRTDCIPWLLDLAGYLEQGDTVRERVEQILVHA